MSPANIPVLAPVLIGHCVLQTLVTDLVLEILSQRYCLSLLLNSFPQPFSATINFSKLLYNPSQSDDPQYASHFMSCLDEIFSKLCNSIVILPNKNLSSENLNCSFVLKKNYRIKTPEIE